MSAEPDVDLRMWEPGLPDKREEALLGLRAGQAGTRLPVEQRLQAALLLAAPAWRRSAPEGGFA